MTRNDSVTHPGEGPGLPSSETCVSLSSAISASIDKSVDSVSTHEIEETLRLLDEIWPRDVGQGVDIPRRIGRFSILGELGRGGFGVVYLAHDPLAQRNVALKVPRMGVLSESESWKRFLREARAASRLDHPNLIPMLEAGAIGPVGYIVSAHVAGPSLEQWLRHNPDEVSPGWGARLILDLAHAIEHAHQRGILHGDLKPGNVLLQAPERDGPTASRRDWNAAHALSWTPRICDFGMAKLHEIEAEESRSRVVAGSPPYMAPEQAEARQAEIGPATDIYGLGAILYQILTGRPPFSGKNDLETLHLVVNDEPVPPRQLRPIQPRDLETICLKCLAKNPQQRYQSAAALADDLARFLDGRPIRARPVAVWERGWRWARRRPALAALATAMMLALIAGLGGLLWHESVLRRLNEQLRLEARRAEANAEEARIQRSQVELREGTVRRQLAGHQISSAQHAVMAKNFVLAHRLLEAASTEIGTANNRDFAWSHLSRYTRDRLQVFIGHNASVEIVAVDHGGKTLASGDAAGEVRLWNIATGRSLRLPATHSTKVKHVVFSPDDRTLASCSENIGETILWDLPEGRLRGRLTNSGPGAVSSLMFIENGTRLVAVRAGLNRSLPPIACWDITAATGDFPRVSADELARIGRDLTDERLERLAELLDENPSAFTSLSTVSELKDSLRTRPARGVACTRDGELAVIATGDGTFEVYRTAVELHLGTGQFRGSRSALVLRDPTKVVAFATPQDRRRPEWMASHLFASSPGRKSGCERVERLSHTDRLALSPDGQQLAIWREDSNRLSVIDATTGNERAHFALGELNDLHTLCFTPDGANLAFGTLDREVQLWHLRPPRDPDVLRGHSPKEAWSVAFAPDGQTIASSGDDYLVRLWDPATGQEKATLRGHHALVSTLAFSSDGHTLASGSFDTHYPTSIIVWDIATLSRRFFMRSSGKAVRSIAFHPDGRTLASVSGDLYVYDQVMIWDTNSGRQTGTIGQPNGDNRRLAFSPSGQTLASASGTRGIALTDMVTGLSRMITTDTAVSALTFSRDGSQINTGHARGKIETWDVASGSRVQTFPGHANAVLGLTLAPDGRTLASASEDRTVRVWDSITGQQLLCLTDCKARVNAVAFSPDGRTLAAADHTGAVTLWRTDP
jgi:WD40 repeat protein